MKYRSNSILAFTPQNSIGEKVLLQTLYFSEVLQMRIFALQIPGKSNLISRKLQNKKIELLQNEANQKLTGFIEETIQKKIVKK